MLAIRRIIGAIDGAETIAEGTGIREHAHLRERFGGKNWRKRKGIASVELDNGTVVRAEIHWYEGHGVGKVKIKIKRTL